LNYTAYLPSGLFLYHFYINLSNSWCCRGKLQHCNRATVCTRYLRFLAGNKFWTISHSTYGKFASQWTLGFLEHSVSGGYRPNCMRRCKLASKNYVSHNRHWALLFFIVCQVGWVIVSKCHQSVMVCGADDDGEFSAADHTQMCASCPRRRVPQRCCTAHVYSIVKRSRPICTLRFKTLSAVLQSSRFDDDGN